MGCFGRRYGSRHNEANQHTHWVGTALDRAAGQYPWVLNWRDRGITELEYRCVLVSQLRIAKSLD